ncbi:hypothetical protein OUZ56_032678 [Daphnia magna]|uniref:Uncharacterized protein n=1 Tax=Daphnia magna TaxID=35525 RepID=A0ABQ9ZX36_9CRUS|nr:hypothetical protein OUZ56_032678 [Daphnia magna]
MEETEDVFCARKIFFESSNFVATLVTWQVRRIWAHNLLNIKMTDRMEYCCIQQDSVRTLCKLMRENKQCSAPTRCFIFSSTATMQLLSRSTPLSSYTAEATAKLESTSGWRIANQP